MDTASPADATNRTRLLAVLAADAVGFSRLMSRDDHGTVTALDAARIVFSEHIALHDGRVIDMAGDSVLAVFETATAAVKAALAIQQQLGSMPGNAVPEDRRMRFRIGVHLGDVIEKADGSVYGDGVNIAARLQSLADPASVAVSEPVRSTVKGRLPAAFEDLGQQRAKNIADPLRAFRVTQAAAPPTAGHAPPATDLDMLPGIAVLPFTCASGDAEHAVLADGLVDDIIGSLASVRGLLVIARSSTFTYKGSSADARTVGQELGVGYVVEGSLRVMAQRMRLNVNLIDCRSNSSLWSERFDAPIEDMFVVQDEITTQIVNAVRVTINRSEARASRKLDPRGLRAWQLRAQTADHYHRWNRIDMLKAIELSRRAVELAPDDAMGHAYLAGCLWAAAVGGWLPSGLAAIDEALRLARQAINLDETLAMGHTVMAAVLTGLRRHDEAIAAAERACELAPGDFMVNNQRGQTLAYAGRYDEALRWFDRALRLNPRDPGIYSIYQTRALASFGLHRYAELVAAAQRVARQLPDWVSAHTMMAAGYVGLGQLQQAAAAIENARKLDPRLTVQRVMRKHPIRDEADAARLAGFLQQAGLPES
jgi:adenylate cyclase